ncbi:MAG: sodium:solute symporter family transporter, partial [Parachlamydiaceae bacterium]
AACVGLLGISYFPEGIEKPELLFVEMVKSIFNPFVAGIFLCSLVSATMSTMDSQILVAASVLSEDVYKQFAKTAITEKKLLTMTRWALVFVSIVSLCISFNKSTSILDAVYYAWTGLGCSFGPLMLMSLYYKNSNKYGAIVGIIVGGVIAGVWHLINPLLIDYPIPAMIPGFLLSTFAIYAVSRLTLQNVARHSNVE